MENVLEEGGGRTYVGALEACFGINGIQGPIFEGMNT